MIQHFLENSPLEWAMLMEGNSNSRDLEGHSCWWARFYLKISFEVWIKPDGTLWLTESLNLMRPKKLLNTSRYSPSQRPKTTKIALVQILSP
jgi:hypothetical protein